MWVVENGCQVTHLFGFDVLCNCYRFIQGAAGNIERKTYKSHTEIYIFEDIIEKLFDVAKRNLERLYFKIFHECIQFPSLITRFKFVYFK